MVGQQLSINSFNVGHSQPVGPYYFDPDSGVWFPAQKPSAYHATPYLYAVAEGNIEGHHSLFKFGARTIVTAGAPSTIWEGPTNLYAYLASGQSLAVSSSSAADTASAGTGARSVTLHGLDASFNPYSETVDLNGTGVVYTTGLFRRQFRTYVNEVGATQVNMGAISVKDNSDTNTVSIITAQEGQTLMAVWTVPSGHTFYATDFSVSTSSNKGAEVSVYVKANTETYNPWRIAFRQYAFQGSQAFNFNSPIAISEMYDIEVRVLTPGSAGNTSFGASFGGWYESN